MESKTRTSTLGGAPRCAAVYCRISDDREGRGLGVERQEPVCRQLVAANGWVVHDVYVDNDVSAFRGKPRPAFERMVEDIKAGRVNAIAAWAPARLTRHNRELEDLIDLLDANDVEVATHIAGKYDLSSSGGRLVARVVGAVARHESEEKSERIKSKMEQLASHGSFHGGKRPYGYEADGRTIRPEEAENIRFMAQAVLEGASVVKVAAELNERGVPAAQGGAWTHSRVRALLALPRLAGLRIHNGEVVADAGWPAILDRATFEAVQAVVADPKRRHRGYSVHFLTGLLYTPDGRRLVGNRQVYPKAGIEKDAYAAKPGVVDGQRLAGLTIEASAVETWVEEYVLDYTDRVALASGPAVPQPSTEVVDLEAELAELADMRGAGEISFAEWRAAREGINVRLEAARARVPEMPSVPPTMAVVLGQRGELRRRWPSLNTRQRRQALEAVLERVIVKPVGKGWGKGMARGTAPALSDRLEAVLR
jgi:DNA invertase Pin-like site-specific DNA recombinase